MRKRNRLCYLSKRTNSDAVKNEFKKLKVLVQRQLRSSYQQYLQNILCNPHNPHKVNKHFWSFIRKLKRNPLEYHLFYQTIPMYQIPWLKQIS